MHLRPLDVSPIEQAGRHAPKPTRQPGGACTQPKDHANALDGNGMPKLCLILKPLYGTKQAGRRFQRSFFSIGSAGPATTEALDSPRPKRTPASTASPLRTPRGLSSPTRSTRASSATSRPRGSLRTRDRSPTSSTSRSPHSPGAASTSGRSRTCASSVPRADHRRAPEPGPAACPSLQQHAVHAQHRRTSSRGHRRHQREGASRRPPLPELPRGSHLSRHEHAPRHRAPHRPPLPGHGEAHARSIRGGLLCPVLPPRIPRPRSYLQRSGRVGRRRRAPRLQRR